MTKFRSSLRTSLARAAAAGTLASAVLPAAATAQAPATAKRPMTFIDMQHIRQAAAPTPSPDGRRLLYTLSTPDWKEAKRQTDVYLVSVEQGVSSTKQMTFTKDKNETAPRWARDGSFFVFSSNREAPASSATQAQLYAMRADGGEARRITDAKDGVSTFAFTHDGKWLIYRAGKSGEEQLHRMTVAGIDSAKPQQITKQSTGVGTWRSSPDSRRIYFA
ncbi:MAG: PD40 domain-containing protein, partial [Gemmatimonadaceae bacterium]|nr:PD40 domain-containing protein [Gemmatimonadaceae bacterium]